MEIASYSWFVSSAGKLSVGWGGWLGTVELEDGKISVKPEIRPPMLEHPMGVAWTWDLVDTPSGMAALGIGIQGPQGRWHIPLDGAQHTYSRPTFDAQGRFWIALPGGLRGYRFAQDGPKLIHEIPYDWPTRNIWKLEIDATGTAWMRDTENSDLLCISLPP